MIHKIIICYSNGKKREIERESLEALSLELKEIPNKGIRKTVIEQRPAHGNGVSMNFETLSDIKVCIETAIQANRAVSRRRYYASNNALDPVEKDYE